jgi:iron complex outermembrane receptor protein
MAATTVPRTPSPYRFSSRSPLRGFIFWATLLFFNITFGAILIPETTAAEEPSPPVEEPGSAVIEELELIKEEESVSIASRYEQPISEAPSEVYVITDEDIRKSGAIDLPTILRRIPGMEVMQTTGADFNVSVRGDNQLLANKLLVLVDGRSIYIDAQGQVYWKLIPVTLPEIKRIEVLKGPASAVWGFNAFDGVVNIITKSAEEMKGTTLQFGGGQYGTISSAAIHAGTAGKFGYRLSVGHDQNQQWRNSDALAFRANKFNVQTDYKLPAETKLLVSGGLVDANRYDGPLTATVFNQTTPSLGYAYAALERRKSFLRAWWYGYWDTADNFTNPLLANFIRVTDRNGSSINSVQANTYNIEGQDTVELWSENSFTYGINYRHNSLSSNFTTGFSHENRLGFYLQDEWRPIKGLSLIAGGRYDLDTFINPTISPRGTILYKPHEDHTFRVSVSVAYRPPTLFETNLLALSTITLPPPLPSPAPRFAQGAPNLSPERIVSYQAGYQGWFFQHRLRARGELFYNHLSDLISNLSGQGVNQGDANIYGVEVGVEFLATRWLTAFANYTYQGVDQNLPPDTQRAVPRNKANAGLRGEWENGLSAEVLYHYYGAATYPLSQAFTTFAPLGGFTPPSPRVSGYNLLNLRGAYRFWQQKAAAGFLREAEVAVSAFNATDDKHKEYPLGDTIGSRWMGWLTVRF